MSYTYTAILQVRNSSGRFVDYTNAATITAHDLAGNAIPGSSLTNRGTGFYVASVTQSDLEDVVFRIIPHLDDQPLHPDQTLIHERVIHTLDDGVTDIIALINGLPEAVAVLTYNDLTYNGTGHELVSGAVVANDASDTMAYGGDAFELRPDAGVVLDVNFEFELGTARVDELRIRARMTGNPPTAQAYANVYAYDYLAAAWSLISDASNRIPFSATLVDRTYILGASMQATDGTVKIRYLTNRTADTDILYLDFHAVEGVNTGVTVGEIAEGIWAHNIRNRALDGTHRSAGFFLSRTEPNWATVDTVVGADVTFSANDYLQEDDHIYANRTIQFHKAGEYIYEIRKCVDNIGRVFTLDQAPILVDGSTWHAYMLPEISEDVSNLDVAVSTRAPASEYDTELTDLQTDITTIVTDYARRTGDYAPANEYDAELLALQADITTIVTDYARRVGDYAPPNEYDAELLALQADITTIVTDYARRTGDYAIPNEYDAELLALQADITTIVTDYARRVGDYAPPNEYDADITGIRSVTDQFVFTIANQVDANALTGGGGATAGEVRIEMDANSTRLADIQERTDRIPNIPAPADEYDAEFALLQGNITTILADYARRTGDYAIPNEYDAALAVIAGNVATILIDYARRTGDYAPANEYDVELAAIQALIEALMGVGWVDETLVEIMNEILGLGPVGTALLENRINSLIQALQHNTALTRYIRTDQIEIKRSSDVDFTLRGLTPLAGRTSLYFTVKEMKEKDSATDAQSIIQLEETAGLLRINKAPATAANGSLTVTDEVAGVVNITIDAIETDKLTPNQMYCYDVKMDNIILSEGKFMVTTAITRTIT